MLSNDLQNVAYPTPESLLANLPIVLRALTDYLLSGEAKVLDATYRIASVMDTVEGVQTAAVPAERRH